jgi:hypothetical protein
VVEVRSVVRIVRRVGLTAAARYDALAQSRADGTIDELRSQDEREPMMEPRERIGQVIAESRWPG